MTPALTEGVLSATITEALRLRDRMRADGATATELDAALEKTLRAAWPFAREWKVLCATCRDYGLDLHQCAGDATCGRTRPHLPHDYGEPCWCAAGKRFRAPMKTEDDFTQAGTVKRRPSRFGR